MWNGNPFENQCWKINWSILKFLRIYLRKELIQIRQHCLIRELLRSILGTGAQGQTFTEDRESKKIAGILLLKAWFVIGHFYHLISQPRRHLHDWILVCLHGLWKHSVISVKWHPLFSNFEGIFLEKLNIHCYMTQQSYHRNLLKKMHVHTDLFINVHSSFIHNSPYLRTTQVPINIDWWNKTNQK